MNSQAKLIIVAVLLADVISPPASIIAAQAQDVPGIEICTRESRLDRRTSCLQSNIEFLQQVVARNALDAQQKLGAANRDIAALKELLAAANRDIGVLKELLAGANRDLAVLKESVAAAPAKSNEPQKPPPPAKPPANSDLRPQTRPQGR
jgi:hypothetical protein